MQSMRILLSIELLILVGPAAALWVVGIVLVPIQFYALLLPAVGEDGAMESLILVFGSVVAGTCGLISVADLYRKAVNPDTRTLSTRWLSVLGLAGSLPLIYFAMHSNYPWPFIFLMPIAAGVHLAYLGRHALFTNAVGR